MIKKFLSNQCVVMFMAVAFHAHICADVISNFAQGLQSIVQNSVKDQKDDGLFYAKLLAEIRKLPPAPEDYPKADLFTADILLNTAKKFVDGMEEKLKNTQWIDTGGTKDYLFVRKLILPVGSIIEFRGDLHGDVHSLIRWLDSLTEKGWFDKKNPFKLVKKGRYLAFLGDYTDRGHYGAEVMYIIMQLFLHNPDNVLIVRGNHEDLDIVARYGFFNLQQYGFPKNNGELNKKFPDDDRFKISLGKDGYVTTQSLDLIIDVYKQLPVALYLGCKNNNGGVDFVQCCHGGMEPGYDSRILLSDKDNHRADVYEWIDKKIDMAGSEERQKVACKRHPHLEEDLKTHVPCEKNSVINGFQWNDFDFKNSLPEMLISEGDRGGAYLLYQKYTTHLLEDATDKDSKNKVLAVFRAHQHGSDTIPHILKYGNGIYKNWSNKGSDSSMQQGFKDFTQWSGKEGYFVPLDTYSVWTFNVAPQTGWFDKYFKVKVNNEYVEHKYDTVARLELDQGFDKWYLHPRQIPVK